MDTGIDEVTLYHVLQSFDPKHRLSGDKLRRDITKRLGRRVSLEMFADICRELVAKKLIVRSSADTLVRKDFLLNCMMPSHLHYWLTPDGMRMRVALKLENIKAAAKPPVKVI